ncbi:odorant receptor 10-like [Colletes latitarsis]|uniref:odorant receptor 10-like n=1 Tax=Colletes latitarsis TaxID=2605962 RepID=UPI0040357F80
MILEHYDDISVVVATKFMKYSGLWMAANRVEQIYRYISLIYSISTTFFIGSIVTIEFYYTKNDFTNCLFNASNILTVFMPLFKLLVLFAHKDDFFNLILYLKRKFLHSNYDLYEGMILDTSKRTCAFFVCTFTCCCHATIVNYIISAIVVNIGRNESDRVLPFNIRSNVLSMTPYFEIVFVLQSLSVYQIGILYFSFDNFMCIMNIHVAGQFRILQYRLENIKNAIKRSKKNGNSNATYYNTFKTYVAQHQELIAYCDKLEETFSLYTLGQVLLFSLLICLDGYLILAVSIRQNTDTHPAKRLIFVFHMIASVAQLFMFTYSCDCLIQDSTNVATAMYSAPWSCLAMNEDTRTLRRDLTLVIVRSRVSCCLTGYGFFTVSLETYTKVLSTAASYFTLLRQNNAATP